MRQLPDIPMVTQEEAEQDPYPKDARIVIPNKAMQEEILERAHNRHRCGECKHFMLRQGQHELMEQKVFERLYEELEHDMAWYGRTDLFGLCDEWEGHMCAIISPACIPAKFLDSTLPYEAQDAPKDCPSFRKRSGSGVAQSKRHYIGKRTNYEE